MREVAVVINLYNEPIFWHEPDDSSSGAIPDSRSLWDIIWENRNVILGVAHSHPGGGYPGPSGTDIGTFKAIELALGRPLNWWIASSNKLSLCLSKRAGSDEWCNYELPTEPEWVDELRMRSHYGGSND